MVEQLNNKLHKYTRPVMQQAAIICASLMHIKRQMLPLIAACYKAYHVPSK